ncbi:Anti-sigma-K factor rskA [Leifsonia sp. 98AMF]|uniref:anti-sigma factor n=1 Tax=unclassified Leifsonia TaxID=2663824 RepID=UPI00087C9F96|nr:MULTISPECIES: anti-sigma factor [unclassified Leifsonia]SDH53912.1 Anti-sigma-K factor rskA [Leifsonia sp. 197AMF]SDI84637.1 Anti-sigma-K factor rskA [Leifsonia sp. 466MF]SDJ98348.1 Anti-sigma-K factor rskA [Leifsonia sp. 157MF]SDN87933.1 Anti-sigma-K factor rskA [Leifsonia sp. 509MF]SEN18208.1 Anti-sigma-K factor rskA [Leifsonia sp. 467MF]
MTREDDRDAGRLGYRLGADDEQEARAFEDVAAELALSAEPVQPRPELKAALFARLQNTPQLPAQDVAQPTAEPVAAPAEAADASPAPEAAPGATPGRAERAAQRRWFQRPGLLLGAAAAAIVLFVGGAFVGSTLSGGNSYQSQQASALAEINAAPDVQRATAQVEGGGTATLVWSGELGRSALVANDLPALPSDKTYELWYLRDGQAIPAGTMNPANSGSTWRVLTGDMAAGDTVGVTVEPSGGSDKPTSPPIVAIAS